jgi:hypothetical protein
MIPRRTAPGLGGGTTAIITPPDAAEARQDQEARTRRDGALPFGALPMGALTVIAPDPRA